MCSAVPSIFPHDAEHDRLAQGRLLRAAFSAGYEKVYLQFEPVAAALSYETTLTQPQNVLVFDFGGGTLDITVIRLGDPGQRARAVHGRSAGRRRCIRPQADPGQAAAPFRRRQLLWLRQDAQDDAALDLRCVLRLADDHRTAKPGKQTHPAGYRPHRAASLPDRSAPEPGQQQLWPEDVR